MKPIVIIKGPQFSTEEDERSFKRRLDDMRQDGYHVLGITSTKEERITVRVFKTGWFSQLLHFLKDRSDQRGWLRATDHRRERDAAKLEITRLQELALQFGAPPHQVHQNDEWTKNIRRAVIYSGGLPTIVLTICLALAGCDRAPVEPGEHRYVDGGTMGVYDVVKIDGCEYVVGCELKARYQYGIVHKANCSNPIHKPCR